MNSDKQQLIDDIKERISQIESDVAKGWTVDEFLLKPLRIAKASLTADPVAFTEKHEISNMQATGMYIRAWPSDRERNEIEGYNIPLYTTPPASIPALPDNFISHEGSWRLAIERLIELEPESGEPDIDNKAFWKHELAAFNRAYAKLRGYP